MHGCEGLCCGEVDLGGGSCCWDGGVLGSRPGVGRVRVRGFWGERGGMVVGAHAGVAALGTALSGASTAGVVATRVCVVGGLTLGRGGVGGVGEGAGLAGGARCGGVGRGVGAAAGGGVGWGIAKGAAVVVAGR